MLTGLLKETGQINRTMRSNQSAERPCGDKRFRKMLCAIRISTTTTAPCREFWPTQWNKSASETSEFILFPRFVEDVAKFANFLCRKFFMVDEMREHRLE